MSTNKDLKAYIRIDGSGRDVQGSLVLRTRMPGNGKWRQVLTTQCCNPVVTPPTTTTTTTLPTTTTTTTLALFRPPLIKG